MICTTHKDLRVIDLDQVSILPYNICSSIIKSATKLEHISLGLIDGSIMPYLKCEHEESPVLQNLR